MALGLIVNTYKDFFEEFFTENNSKPFVRGINKVTNEKLITLFLKYKGNEIPHPRLGNPNWYADRGLILNSYPRLGNPNWYADRGLINDIYDRDCMNDKHFQLKDDIYQPLFDDNINVFYNENKNTLYIHYGQTMHPETKSRDGGNIFKLDFVKKTKKRDYKFKKELEIKHMTFLIEQFKNKNSEQERQIERLSMTQKEMESKIERLSLVQKEMEVKHNELVNRLLDRIVELSDKN